jgi:hypothetical protein
MSESDIIADDDLGAFAPGVRLWLRQIGLAAPDKRCDVHHCRAGDRYRQHRSFREGPVRRLTRARSRRDRRRKSGVDCTTGFKNVDAALNPR